MSKGFHITEDIFGCCKTLINKGLSNIEIARVVGIGKETVRRIGMADDYSDYKEKKHAESQYYQMKYKQKKDNKCIQQSFDYPVALAAEKDEQPNKPADLSFVISNYQMNRLIEETKKNNDLLTSICNILNGIYDDLTGTPAAK